MAARGQLFCLVIVDLSSAYLATSLAHVRLLASVDSGMHSESTALDELLATIWVVANMRTNATVNAFYSELAQESYQMGSG